jgi:hypothetical protein
VQDNSQKGFVDLTRPLYLPVPKAYVAMQKDSVRVLGAMVDVPL